MVEDTHQWFVGRRSPAENNMTDELPESFETPGDRQKRIENEKFAALGRFVQEFELMVAEVRDSCQDLVSEVPSKRVLLNLVFHHRVFTAQPLFDVMRALYAEVIAADPEVEKKEREAILSVLKQVGTE